MCISRTFKTLVSSGLHVAATVSLPQPQNIWETHIIQLHCKHKQFNRQIKVLQGSFTLGQSGWFPCPGIYCKPNEYNKWEGGRLSWRQRREQLRYQSTWLQSVLQQQYKILEKSAHYMPIVQQGNKIICEGFQGSKKKPQMSKRQKQQLVGAVST